MNTTELKTFSNRFSLADWQFICTDPRSFSFSSMEEKQAEVVCETILLERAGLMPQVTAQEESARLSAIAAAFGPA